MTDPASFRPVAVREAELSQPLTGITAGLRYGSARVLARWYSEPLTFASVPLRDGRASVEQVARTLWQAVEPLVAARRSATLEPVPALVSAGATELSMSWPTQDRGFPAELLTTGLRLPWPPGYLIGRATALRNAPQVSVIVCGQAGTAQLACCLAAVLNQDYPDFEIIVVDRAPAAAAVTDLLSRLAAAGKRGVPLRLVTTARAGVSRARNAGLAAADGAVVAYLDADTQPDRYWLTELVRGFTLSPGITGVSGLVLPTTLDTPAQELYERFGGPGRGRRFTHQVLGPQASAGPHPWSPFGFGFAAAMAFDRAALTRIGGFDVALGAGTLARAGEDTAAVADLMLTGGTFAYWPGALVWHRHGETLAELEQQLSDYGSGLTACYTRAILRGQRRRAALARLALRGQCGTSGPASVRRAGRHGLLAGPVRYLRSRIQNRKVERP
jgi:GT2 family glycosyltransferase